MVSSKRRMSTKKIAAECSKILKELHAVDPDEHGQITNAYDLTFSVVRAVDIGIVIPTEEGRNRLEDFLLVVKEALKRVQTAK